MKNNARSIKDTLRIFSPILCSCVLVYLVFPSPAHADVDISKNFGSPFTAKESIGQIVSIVLANSITIAGVILLFLIAFFGLGMISGAGQNDPQKKAQGKNAVTAAIIGFLIILSTYMIIQLIQLVTGIQIL